jgi:prepilin-type processing-associated H-X9-DG protein
LPKAATTRAVDTRIPVGLDGVFKNAYIDLLPYLEEGRLQDLYDNTVPWYWQRSELTSAVLPTLMCPSNYDADNPYFDAVADVLLGVFGSPAGGHLGLTTYVFSKGPNDAYCNDGERIPPEQRGMFDYNLKVELRQVGDGLSKTLAIGEGASGRHWQMCRDPGCTTPDLAQPAELEEYFARQYWIGSGGNKSIYDAPAHWASAGIVAGTVDHLNKNPVTLSLYDDSTNGRQCEGTLRNAANTHRVANFRSDHPGGVNFLLGDGGVRFLTQTIDVQLLRALSTTGGDEVADGGL